MSANFEYKDSIGYGIAIALVLIGVWVDMIAVRCALAIAAATLLLWPFLHRRFGMTPATTLMLVSAAGLVCGFGWYVAQSRDYFGLFSQAPDKGVGDRWTWAALTPAEIDGLYSLLRKAPRASVDIACNRPECVALADSFDGLFRRLGWPSAIVDGGIFAIGVTGTYIGPSDDSARVLKDAIETTTALRPDLGQQRDKGTTHPIMLIIGTKPASMPIGPFIPAQPADVAPRGQGGKGGSGEIFGNDGTIIGGKGGNVGSGGVGRGGEGGGGVIHGDGGTIIGGEGGSVDGTNIWFPPAQSGYIQHLESQGQTPDFGVQYPGAGGASEGWLQHQQIVVKIREEYFKKTGQEAKIRSSKIEDVPLEYINEKLKEAGYSWRARIEKKYWYLYYTP